MREYEVTVILKSNISEEDHDKLIERITAWLVPDEDARGSLLTAKHWGNRKLAYPIEKHTEGFYAFYEVRLENDAIPNIERNMQYNESILRYMFIRKEEEAKEEAQEVEEVQEVAKADEAASED